MVMPSSAPSEARVLPGARVLIVEARFYNEIADALLEAQAQARARKDEMDKGGGAMRAALAVLHLRLIAESAGVH